MRLKFFAFAAFLTAIVAATAGAQEVVDRTRLPNRFNAGNSQNASDAQLWEWIVASRGYATIALKTPDAQRGAWKGEVLISAAEEDLAKNQVLAVGGFEVVRDRLPPSSRSGRRYRELLVKFATAEKLSELRRLPYVDYLEPLFIPLDLMQIGCTGNLTNLAPAGGDLYKGAFDPPITLNGQSFTDAVPPLFVRHNIPKAWSFSATGAGIDIHVIDTGVFPEQNQLFDDHTWPFPSTGLEQFATGASAGRRARHYAEGYHPNEPLSVIGRWDTCNHGTRVAGTATAPLDDRNIVGVAFKAGLWTHKINDKVIVDGLNQLTARDVIVSLPGLGLKSVVAMAFGSAIEWNRRHMPFARFDVFP
jgi:hypothetical protein